MATDERLGSGRVYVCGACGARFIAWIEVVINGRIERPGCVKCNVPGEVRRDGWAGL